MPERGGCIAGTSLDMDLGHFLYVCLPQDSNWFMLLYNNRNNAVLY